MSGARVPLSAGRSKNEKEETMLTTSAKATWGEKREAHQNTPCWKGPGTNEGGIRKFSAPVPREKCEPTTNQQKHERKEIKQTRKEHRAELA